MAKTKILIALVAVVALTLIAVGVASAQIVATQTTNPTEVTAPNGGFWGYMGRCFQFWANQPVNQTTGAPIAPAIPGQVYNTTAPTPAGPSGYGFRCRCVTRYW